MAAHLDRSTLLEAVASLVREAGDIVMDVYSGDFSVANKSDASPVTEADRRAEAFLLSELSLLDPGTPVVSEEAAEAGALPAVGPRFWLVDPLDGTKEFIQRNGEFTVNVALIEAGHPVLGVVAAPALGRLYAGALGVGAWMQADGVRAPLACRAIPAEGLTVVASRSHGDAAALERLLAGRKVASLRNAGSSLKICLVAAGEADLYPRQGRTMEWDIAAGHAVLVAAGGAIAVIAGGEVPGEPGTPLRYGKPGFENPYFVAQGLA